MAAVSARDAVRAGTGLIGVGFREAPAALGLLGLAFILTTLAPGAADNQVNMLILSLIRLPFGALAAAALLRLALGRAVAADSGPPGPGGLQWGHLEWRVIGAQVLVGLLIAALVLALALLIGLIFGVLVATKLVPDVAPPASPLTPQAAAAMFTGSSGLALMALFAPLAVVLIYVGLKLSLAVVDSAAAGRIKVLDSWALSRGALWPIFAVVIVSTAIALLGQLIGLLLGQAVGAVGGSAAAGILEVLGAALGAVLSLPVQIGGLVHVYLAARNSRAGPDRGGL